MKKGTIMDAHWVLINDEDWIRDNARLKQEFELSKRKQEAYDYLSRVASRRQMDGIIKKIFGGAAAFFLWAVTLAILIG